ncbi:ABC transporter ATP-binding protein [Oceanirhabdus seepicola]|uniref:Sn-glycerol-3-phosphate ABC transporter ATP-binding protein UgpC n=1 Tax=Oceanirhabdus seepicola TaxID=2828781 RepID=A0A9J6P0U0_9CLOT|nr:sn-glycerol-3-phosphate ABC transporter ATP-binding protein UgpC [Oceanirhabdus seepicola]MCM1989525.1 sn-glycerol-3-phosphate ABC transporter ATP-binding protein UgpC [Oceanirhabdus seepicola]
MAGLNLKGINKIYPNGYHAVKDVSFEIEDKEFIVLVGPSGCGKSTTLRMIAGLEEISDGQLYIGDKVVNDVHPKDRDIAMVFQNYALYPHMSVYENMAFGLKLRKYPKADIDKRVNNAARILGIEELLPRKPKQLSGGQRQRVALGRAIVREPKVFLMDEPLSNLDAKLRVQMRAELSKLHKELQTTFVYVTHDQTEAMTMGSRIVVMKDGVVQQIDNPQTIYEHPVNRFIASFIGSPQMNFLDCKIVKNSDKMYLDFFDSNIDIPEDKIKIIKENHYVGKEILLGIRPESVLIDDSNEGILAKVEVTEMLGSETYLYLNANGYNIIARVDPSIKASVGDDVRIKFVTDKIHIFDRESEKAIF